MIEGLKVENPKITAKVADGTVEMNIECEDYGIIIGRRGETLNSLQYLTSLAIKNVTNKYVRVTLNVGDYRAKREKKLSKHLQPKMQIMLQEAADAIRLSL